MNMKVFGFSLTTILVLFAVFMLGKHSASLMGKMSGGM